jgi:hypothetical protein
MLYVLRARLWPQSSYLRLPIHRQVSPCLAGWLKWSLTNSLPVLALNLHPPNLCFLRSWICRHAPLYPTYTWVFFLPDKDREGGHTLSACCMPSPFTNSSCIIPRLCFVSLQLSTAKIKLLTGHLGRTGAECAVIRAPADSQRRLCLWNTILFLKPNIPYSLSAEIWA